MSKKQNIIEHLNITVSSPEKTAKLFCTIFDWKIRWSGPSLDNGTTIHVGGENSYLALYSHSESNIPHVNEHTTVRNLNHIGIVVNNIAEIEHKVLAQGLTPFNYREYIPGAKCFYFKVDDDIEIEVVCYG